MSKREKERTESEEVGVLEKDVLLLLLLLLFSSFLPRFIVWWRNGELKFEIKEISHPRKVKAINKSSIAQ